jgi:hypothetical protein
MALRKVAAGDSTEEEQQIYLSRTTELTSLHERNIRYVSVFCIFWDLFLFRYVIYSFASSMD